MMNNEQNDKLEDILNSLDGCSRAEAPGFFYTRLKARMEKEAGTTVSRPWILRPVFAVATLVLVLMINAFVLLQRNTKSAAQAAGDTDIMQSIASEYRLNENSSLYDITQDNK